MGSVSNELSLNPGQMHNPCTCALDFPRATYGAHKFIKMDAKVIAAELIGNKNIISFISFAHG